MNNKIAILGAGGHGKVVGEIAYLNKFEVIDFYDDIKFSTKENFPFQILGTSKDFKNNLKKYDACFLAIGNNKIRYEKNIWLGKSNQKLVNLFHPNSFISKNTIIGKGNCVMANAVINIGSSIGNGVIINSSASIDHDCIVQDFAHVSPNCSLSGNVNVGKFTHVGTGSSVHPGIKIGNNVKIGVGSRIYKNILDNTIYKD